MKTINTLASVLCLLATSHAMAATGAITKTATPGVVVVVAGGGQGLSQFNVLSADFPSGTLSATKTLTGIAYQTTTYPSNTETVQLCYLKPYSSAESCVTIAPGSSGTTTAFNTQSFGVGSKVIIRHTLTSGPAPASPAGRDTVTFQYKY